MSVEDGLIRLNKFLATAGVASRRKADLLIKEGNVSINGRPVRDMGIKVNPLRDRVFVNGKQVSVLDAPVCIVLNKPKDCITTVSDEKGRPTVMDYVKVKTRVFPVGRLDRNTTGVLLFTNDGELANRLMHPRYEVKKAYRVTLDRILKDSDADRLRTGVKLDDGITTGADVHIFPGGRKRVVGVVIHEGRNREVRRMFEKLGYDVKRLDRVAYGDITVEGMRRGEWRYLTKNEVSRLRSSIGLD
jgi:23S rRNA pseudouridine2605 synthase